VATVADHVISALGLSGVRRVYGLPGDSLNGFTDAIRRSEISWEHVRHEETAAFAAAADAALSGQLAVCAGSCGPGNLHLINGLFDAQRSRVPVLAIAAHIPRAEIGSEYFQETHPQELFRECSVYCELVSTPEMAPRILDMAMRAAVEDSGVAVVVVPGEIFLHRADVSGWLTRPVVAARSVVRPDDESLARAAQILNEAHAVTVLAGAGVAGCHDALMQLAGTLNAPIVHALRGKEFVEYDNPFDVGMTGLVGFASGYAAMESCDTLLMLGTDFPYRPFYPQNARIAQIDLRPEALGNRCPIELGVLGGVKETIQALLPDIVEKADRWHLDEALEDYAKARKDLDALAESDPHSQVIHPQYVARLVSELANDDAVFTCDVGTPIIWAARYLQMNGRRRLIGSFNHGSMANAMLQAIGAQTAFRDRQVISMSGDGGFTMMMGEFVTLIQAGLNVKVIVLNNGTLGFVEMEMKANGFLDTGCDLKNPNFAEMAHAIGVKGIRVEQPQHLQQALTEAFEHDGPVLVDVVSARQELAMPPRTTLEQAHHFGMFMMRAVLDGRGSQLIDLAKTNLLR
jgi:pyruvate dehydrogenase (quinone)